MTHDDKALSKGQKLSEMQPLHQWRPHVMKPLAEHIPVAPDATNNWRIPDIDASWKPSAKLKEW